MWWHVLLVVVVAVVAQENKLNNPCCQLLNNGRFDEFQACTLISGIEPTCRPTCQYNGREYRVMETVVALPFQCIRLECDMKEEVTVSGNYNTTSLRLVTVDDNPGCCMRGGRMVPNGYKEEDASLPCGELLCRMGVWISGGTQPYCGKTLKECKVGLQSYAHGEIVNVEVMDTVNSTGSCIRHRCHHGEVLLDNCCCVGDGSVVACEDEKVTDSCSEHICEAGSLTTIHHKGCCLINGERYREGEVVYAANNSNPCSEWYCQHGSLLHRTLDTCCRGPGGKMVPQGHPILIDPAKCLLVVCSEEGEAMDRSIPRKCGCCEAGLKIYTNGSVQRLNQCLNTTCINSNWTLNMNPDCMECNLAKPGAGTLQVKVFNNTWSAIERNCLKYTILQQPLLLHQEQEDNDDGDDSSLFPQQEEFSTGGQKDGRGTPTIYASFGVCEPDLVFANPYAFHPTTQHIRKQRIKRHPYLNNNIYAHHHKVKRHHHYTINTNYHHITTTNDHYYHVKNHPYIASNNNYNHHHIKRHNKYKKNHHIKHRNNNNHNHIKRQSNTNTNNSQVEKDTMDQESDNNYYSYQKLQLNKDNFKLQHTMSGEDEGWCCKSVTIHNTKVNVTVLVTGILLINGVETRPPWYNDEGDWVVDVYPHTMSIKVANTVMWLMEEQGLKITGVVTPRVTDLRGLCVTGQVHYSNTVVWSEGEMCEEDVKTTLTSSTTTIPTTPTTNISIPTNITTTPTTPTNTTTNINTTTILTTTPTNTTTNISTPTNITTTPTTPTNTTTNINTTTIITTTPTNTTTNINTTTIITTTPTTPTNTTTNFNTTTIITTTTPTNNNITTVITATPTANTTIPTITTTIITTPTTDTNTTTTNHTMVSSGTMTTPITTTNANTNTISATNITTSPTDNTTPTIPSNTTIPTIPANITTTTNTSCPPHLLERYTFICTLLSSEKVASVKCESVAESEEVVCVQELCDCQQDQALVCLYWITLRHIRRCVALTSPSLNDTSNNSDDKDGVGKKAVDLAVSLLPFIAEYMEDLVIAMVPLNEGFRSAINTFTQFFAPDIIKFLKTLMSVANKLIPDLSPLLYNLESVLYFPKMSLLNNFEGAFQQLVLNMKEPTIQYLEQMVPVCGNFTHQMSNVTSAMAYILGPAVIPKLNQLIQSDLRLLQFLTGHMVKILVDIDSSRILEELTTKVKHMMTGIAPFKQQEIYKFMQLLEKSLDAMSEVMKDILDSGFSKEDLLCVFDKFGVFELLCQGWNSPYCTPSLQ